MKMKRAFLPLGLLSGALFLAACSLTPPSAPQTAQAVPAKPARDPAIQAILSQDLMLAYQFRTGDYKVAPQSIALLEPALAAHPKDAAIGNALAQAYTRAGILAMLPGGNMADAPKLMQRSMAGYEAVLVDHPDDGVALAGAASLRTMMAKLANKPELIPAGVKDMDRAIALAPESTLVRLQRAFFGVNLPANVRNKAHEIEDFTWLARHAGNTRSGAMVRILLGDVHAEAGEKDLARAAYELAAKSVTPAGPQAQARLAALAAGGVPQADITSIRSRIAGDCVMCHGS